jgi:hypothetical protein
MSSMPSSATSPSMIAIRSLIDLPRSSFQRTCAAPRSWTGARARPWYGPAHLAWHLVAREPRSRQEHGLRVFESQLGAQNLGARIPIAAVFRPRRPPRSASPPAPPPLSSEAWTVAWPSSFQAPGLFFPISSWPARWFWFTVMVPRALPQGGADGPREANLVFSAEGLPGRGAQRALAAPAKSSQVKLILSPKQRAKPKTSARKTGSSMPHCVARWVWLLRVLRSGGE